MRELKETTLNTIKVIDTISGDTCELYYRMPTTAERVAFERAAHQWKKNRFVDASAEARIEFGMKILVGFKDGAFSVDGRPISSDPGAPNYYANWKNLARESAGDLVAALATAVFQGARIHDESEDEDDAESPFGASSGE